MSTLTDLDPATKFGFNFVETAAVRAGDDVAETVAKSAVLKAMESDQFDSAEDLGKVYSGALDACIAKGLFSKTR